MKPVLFIAHHFPPMGGPGTNRSLQFVKYLRELGYNPIVLTIAEKDIKEGAYPCDNSLLSQLPSDIEIIRAPTSEPRKIKKILTDLRIYRLLWFFFFPFLWETSALWPFSAYKTSKNLIIQKKIKIVYTTSGPFSSMLLGFLLKRKLQIKWVADLRDPYTDGYMWLWPSKLHWYFSRITEKYLIRKTNKLIVNTNEVKKLYLKRNLISEDKITVITNGYYGE